MANIPGWESSIGPSPSQYGKPHVYARDIQSGSGNCVCGRALRNSRHVQAAPGVPIPEDGQVAISIDDLRTVTHVAAHYLQFSEGPPGEVEALRRVLIALARSSDV